MRDILFTFFNYFVFFYTSMLAIFFVMFAFLSFISLKRRKDYYVESYVRKTIKESPYTPGISVIAPAFNEEKTIIDNVSSMLALEYPLFEVIIVNDGSTDSTLQKMIEYYELVEVPYAYIERIKTKPFKRLLKSTNSQYSRLIVVDKENGGTKRMLLMQVSMPLPILTLSVRMWTVYWKSMLFTVVSLPLFPPINRLSPSAVQCSWPMDVR